MNHPIHPLIVHFPIACWSLSTIGDLAGLFLWANPGDASVETLGDVFGNGIGILMLIGCITGMAAIIAGLYEVTKLVGTQQSIIAVDYHMYAAVSAWCCYSVSVYLRWTGGLSFEANNAAIAASLVGFVCLALTGWFGATLVYTHGVGTNKGDSS